LELPFFLLFKFGAKIARQVSFPETSMTPMRVRMAAMYGIIGSFEGRRSIRTPLIGIDHLCQCSFGLSDKMRGAIMTGRVNGAIGDKNKVEISPSRDGFPGNLLWFMCLPEIGKMGSAAPQPKENGANAFERRRQPWKRAAPPVQNCSGLSLSLSASVRGIAWAR
jgi:hypothetical protein